MALYDSLFSMMDLQAAQVCMSFPLSGPPVMLVTSHVHTVGLALLWLSAGAWHIPVLADLAVIYPSWLISMFL